MRPEQTLRPRRFLAAAKQTSAGHEDGSKNSPSSHRIFFLPPPSLSRPEQASAIALAWHRRPSPTCAVFRRRKREQQPSPEVPATRTCIDGFSLSTDDFPPFAFVHPSYPATSPWRRSLLPRKHQQPPSTFTSTAAVLNRKPLRNPLLDYSYLIPVSFPRLSTVIIIKMCFLVLRRPPPPPATVALVAVDGGVLNLMYF